MLPQNSRKSSRVPNLLRDQWHLTLGIGQRKLPPFSTRCHNDFFSYHRERVLCIRYFKQEVKTWNDCTQGICSAYTQHFDVQKLWTFPIPDEFLPERWNSTSRDMEDSLLLCSLGNRRCPGQPLASVQSSFILEMILSRYSFEIEREGDFLFNGLVSGFIGASLCAKKNV